jgi:hypothetical protein
MKKLFSFLSLMMALSTSAIAETALVTNVAATNNNLSNHVQGAIPVAVNQKPINNQIQYVAGIPGTNYSTYNQKGFYLLSYTAGFGGMIPKELQVSNLQIRYNATLSQVEYSFDYVGFNNFCDVIMSRCNNKLDIVWNFNSVNIQEPGITSFKLNNDARTIELISSQKIDRIDIHALVNGKSVNYPLTQVSPNKFEWFLTPDISATGTMDFFFNYTIKGVGRDTKIRQFNLAGLHPVIFSYFSQDQSRFAMGDAFFAGRVSNPYVHFSLNNGPLMNYPMTVDGLLFNYYSGLYLKSGDVVKFYFTYNFDGKPYDSSWQQFNY